MDGYPGQHCEGAMKLNREVLRKLPLEMRIEIEENAQRKPLTQSELATEQRRILDELRKHKTPGARTDLKGATSETKFSEVRATTLVGRLFNESHKTVERRLAVVDSGDKKLIESMDRTGRVSGVFKRLIVGRMADAIRAEPPPLPGRGPYRVIVADPPWLYANRQEDLSNRSVCPYPPMTIAQICALPVESIAASDCILWLWTTNLHMLNGARDVLDAWGFRAVTILTWAKDSMTTGDWLRGQTEHCIMAVRGKPVVTLTNQTTLLHARRRGHSVKPVEFYDFVENLCPAPRYCYLFSRYRHNSKWDCHGNQAPAEAAE
jgi:N6-adenosine-specific RNA methylase IME4